MLKYLKVRNYALLEDLTLDFEPGLTVITGETGSGKSMIVEAVAALCGEPIEEVAIRTGKDFTEITGIFEPAPQLRDHLKEIGIDVEEEMIVRRRAERGRRQLAFVNDQVVSLGKLKDITRACIDLVGQYENLSLFFPKNHLFLLDAYAGLRDRRRAYRERFLALRDARAEFKELSEAARVKDERIDLLRHEIAEIEKAGMRPGEEEELNREKIRLASSERRATLSQELTGELYEAETGAYGRLSRVQKLLDELTRLDPDLKDLRDESETMVAGAEELYRQVTSYRDRIDFSEARLEEVMTRLDHLNRLKKKYGSRLEQIDSYLAAARAELAAIENRDEALKKLRATVDAAEREAQAIADELFARRQTAAKSLRKKILATLAQLGMEKADFAVNLRRAELSETGGDEVEYFISTNPGEELKPLRKIASGGEISRITLALKTILSDADEIPTIIFDEVDIGIGGRIAEAVGELLATISRDHQILCVTHLAPISVFARHHWRVSKHVKNRETTAVVTKLDRAEREAEIARMIGGKEITRKTMEHAAEILQKVRQR
jgi:DNA repair protein RecN (Recombination protein N)